MTTKDENLVARVMDTLAYYQCRETNPKADHPSMGYHAFSEDQREWLREKKREAAEEIVRMMAAHDAEVAARQIDAPSVCEAIGEVLADMEATAEGTHIASSLALLQEITDAAIRAAVSPPSRTAKRTGYETVGHGVGEHSQKITARAAEYRKAVES